MPYLTIKYEYFTTQAFLLVVFAVCFLLPAVCCLFLVTRLGKFFDIHASKLYGFRKLPDWNAEICSKTSMAVLPFRHQR